METLLFNQIRSVADWISLYVWTFEDKLKRLQSDGYIGARDRDILRAAVEAGNAAIHRGHIPKLEDVNDVMDIIEHLAQSIYVLSDSAKRIDTCTPKRKPRKTRGRPQTP